MKNSAWFFLFLLYMAATLSGCPAFGQSRPVIKDFVPYPPGNFTGYELNCSSYLQWEAPQEPGGGTPPFLAGYSIKRGDAWVYSSGNLNTTSWIDYHFTPATYTYTLYAVYYDPYHSGVFIYSVPVGPVTVALACPGSLPFTESWNEPSFSASNWQFPGGQSNWTIDSANGNPSPAAVFLGDPALTNYTSTLKSPAFDGRPWVCSGIFLDFDYLLMAGNSSGTEKLTVEYYTDSSRYTAVDLRNEGQSGWIHHQADISGMQGKIFRIGFTASGQNSMNIDHWLVDNIRVYGVCKGPANTSFTRNADRVRLSWQPPSCDSLQPVAVYDVYRTGKDGNPPFARLNSLPVNGFEFTDTIPPDITDGLYKYFITRLQTDTLQHTIVCETRGDTITVYYSLGIPDAGIPGIRLYPQPAHDYMRVASNSPVESCDLFNVAGEKVLSFKTGNRKEFNLPVSTLPPGIYVAGIKNVSGKFRLKVVVVR